jgi:hypothetical protein
MGTVLAVVGTKTVGTVDDIACVKVVLGNEPGVVVATTGLSADPATVDVVGFCMHVKLLTPSTQTKSTGQADTVQSSMFVAHVAPLNPSPQLHK